MSLINTHNVAKHLAHSDNAEVRQTYLPRLLIQAKTACTALTEPGAGSDFAAIQTRAFRCDGGWRLNGEKAWIINARHASLAIVYAQCAEPGNRDGIAAFLVDLEDAACERSTSATAVNQASIATGGFTLRDYFAPDAHCLMPAGQAFRAILPELNGARIMSPRCASVCLIRRLHTSMPMGNAGKLLGATCCHTKHGDLSWPKRRLTSPRQGAWCTKQHSKWIQGKMRSYWPHRQKYLPYKPAAIICPNFYTPWALRAWPPRTRLHDTSLARKWRVLPMGQMRCCWSVLRTSAARVMLNQRKRPRLCRISTVSICRAS